MSATPAADGVQQLPLDKIVPNPLQPRKHFDQERLEELAASIKTHGVLQPIIVSRCSGHYQIVVGERRWRAAQQAGLSELPCLIREFAEAAGLEVALIENLQRQDLNPLEEAAAFAFLMREHALKQDDLAERVGMSRSAVANTVRLLNLPPAIQQDLRSGEMSAGHARAVLALEDSALQMRVWSRVKQAHLSVRQTEALVRSLAEGRRSKPKAKRRLAPDWRDVEETLQQRLSAPVAIRPRSRSTGRIEIQYASAEDLDRIVEALMGRRTFHRSAAWGEDLL